MLDKILYRNLETGKKHLVITKEICLNSVKNKVSVLVHHHYLYWFVMTWLISTQNITKILFKSIKMTREIV